LFVYAAASYGSLVVFILYGMRMDSTAQLHLATLQCLPVQYNLVLGPVVQVKRLTSFAFSSRERCFVCNICHKAVCKAALESYDNINS